MTRCKLKQVLKLVHIFWSNKQGMGIILSGKNDWETNKNTLRNDVSECSRNITSPVPEYFYKQH